VQVAAIYSDGNAGDWSGVLTVKTAAAVAPAS
jgi:hypothetical protein